MKLDTIRQKANKTKSQYQLAKARYLAEKESLAGTEKQLAFIQEAQDITQIVSQTIQQQAHEKICKVVTACLQSVFFDEDYGFKIRFERKRNKTEAKLIITNGDNEIEDPMEEDSGGVVDVASFVLRLSCLMLSKPPLRRLIVLDEPFKFVSVEYRDNVRAMLEKLAKDFKIQFIMVTHIEELITGKVVRL
jgi:DNA repair exonuclease SbcCD ATPase subunit